VQSSLSLLGKAIIYIKVEKIYITDLFEFNGWIYGFGFTAGP
jgi:hypothetical protein